VIEIPQGRELARRQQASTAFVGPRRPGSRAIIPLDNDRHQKHRYVWISIIRESARAWVLDLTKL
jgi:hypothetical protein